MEIREAKRKYGRQLLSLPNVTGVWVRDDDGVIVVSVSRKVPLESLSTEERVPRQIEGHPTEVVESTFEKRNGG